MYYICYEGNIIDVSLIYCTVCKHQLIGIINIEELKKAEANIQLLIATLEKQASET